MSDPICPLCTRPIPADVPQSLHHLIPKLKGGKGGPTVLLHHICHKEIHATLTEAELARDYASIDALRAHPRLGAQCINTGIITGQFRLCQRCMNFFVTDMVQQHRWPTLAAL